MFTKKQIAKVTGMVAATLVVSLTVPTGQSHAASLTDNVGSSYSWINSIFQQVWKQANDGKTGGDKSENSDDNNTGNSGNETESPDQNTNEPETPDSNPNPNPNTGTETGEEEQSNVALADKIIKTGEKFMGTPYQYGASSGQTRTFDCSSFTQYVFKQHGISLPRSSRQQSTVGTSIPRSQIQKGDLLFFTTSSSNGRIGHVAIYAGDNKVLHTWGPGGVRYDSLSTKWLDQGYVSAKRVIK